MASLGQKVALIGASAAMSPQDRARLEGLLAALGRQRDEKPGHGNAAPAMPALDAQERLSTGVAPALEGSVEEGALMPSAVALSVSFTNEELERLFHLRRAFLQRHRTTPMEE